MSTPAVESFLTKNKNAFASHDGLPGEFHRKVLFEQARPGKQAAFVTTHGSRLAGRVVMKFATHCVINLGGRHGTPGVMTPSTCIYVAGGKL